MIKLARLGSFTRTPRDPRGYIITVKHLPGGKDRRLLTYASTPHKAKQAAQARLKKEGLDLALSVVIDGTRVFRFFASLRVPIPTDRRPSSWLLIKAARDIDARF